jgi:hypothetical protein
MFQALALHVIDFDRPEVVVGVANAPPLKIESDGSVITIHHGEGPDSVPETSTATPPQQSELGHDGHRNTGHMNQADAQGLALGNDGITQISHNYSSSSMAGLRKLPKSGLSRTTPHLEGSHSHGYSIPTSQASGYSALPRPDDQHASGISKSKSAGTSHLITLTANPPPHFCFNRKEAELSGVYRVPVRRDAGDSYQEITLARSRLPATNRSCQNLGRYQRSTTEKERGA